MAEWKLKIRSNSYLISTDEKIRQIIWSKEWKNSQFGLYSVWIINLIRFTINSERNKEKKVGNQIPSAMADCTILPRIVARRRFSFVEAAELC